MDINLLLGLLKVSAEIFKSERGELYTRLTKQRLKIKKDYQDELNKGINFRSDLKLDRLRFEAEQLGELILVESGNKDN